MNHLLKVIQQTSGEEQIPEAVVVVVTVGIFVVVVGIFLVVVVNIFVVVGGSVVAGGEEELR